MYTNTESFGGNFKNVLQREFKTAKNISIASGYVSSDIIKEFESGFINVADNGGTAKLLLGMAFYEGLSQGKLNTLHNLCTTLNTYDNGSGVYVKYPRRYHGKVYRFNNGKEDNIFVGSSNFSTSGTSGNIECTVPITDTEGKKQAISFLDYLFSSTQSVSILKADIIVPGTAKYKKEFETVSLDKLQTYNPATIDTSVLPKMDYPLYRIAEKEKSSLNIYFGKGRWNKKTGVIRPRPWYEAELIADAKFIRANPLYPIGDFTAYTDDGYIIPMRTQGDYHKNIRSKGSLQILGMWLKGKLQRAGALHPLKPVTNDTLIDYGNSVLAMYKMEEGKYYLKF